MFLGAQDVSLAPQNIFSMLNVDSIHSVTLQVCLK